MTDRIDEAAFIAHRLIAEIEKAQASSTFEAMTAALTKAQGESQANPAWVASRLAWDTEGWMTQLHVEAHYLTVAAMAERQPDRDLIEVAAEYAETLREDLFDWTPDRSTSPGHRLEGDCKREALRNLVGKHSGSPLEWARRFVAEGGPK